MEMHSSRRRPQPRLEIPPGNNRGADRVRPLEWSRDETRIRRDPDGAGAGVAFLRALIAAISRWLKTALGKADCSIASIIPEGINEQILRSERPASGRKDWSTQAKRAPQLRWRARRRRGSHRAATSGYSRPGCPLSWTPPRPGTVTRGGLRRSESRV